MTENISPKDQKPQALRSGGLLSLTIVDKSALYSSYMPYVINGGIFIPTTKDYKLGQDIFLLLQLNDSPEKIPVAGKIIWVTPSGSTSIKAKPGIGVQFSEKDNGSTQKRIEIILGGSLVSERLTRTM
ncbi:MAG: PilZ domain-containing protein [Methylacidiphilales bacterium]|nr:PilZ domain-containing protein [Candidatus Methylacidiphilales bacterium]